MAFSWPFACMLCWTSILPDDCQTYVYSWAWCDWTSRDCRVASKYTLVLWRIIVFFSFPLLSLSLSLSVPLSLSLSLSLSLYIYIYIYIYISCRFHFYLSILLVIIVILTFYFARISSCPLPLNRLLLRWSLFSLDVLIWLFLCIFFLFWLIEM